MSTIQKPLNLYLACSAVGANTLQWVSWHAYASWWPVNKYIKTKKRTYSGHSSDSFILQCTFGYTQVKRICTKTLFDGVLTKQYNSSYFDVHALVWSLRSSITLNVRSIGCRKNSRCNFFIRNARRWPRNLINRLRTNIQFSRDRHQSCCSDSLRMRLIKSDRFWVTI